MPRKPKKPKLNLKQRPKYFQLPPPPVREAPTIEPEPSTKTDEDAIDNSAAARWIEQQPLKIQIPSSTGSKYYFDSPPPTGRQYKFDNDQPEWTPIAQHPFSGSSFKFNNRNNRNNRR